MLNKALGWVAGFFGVLAALFYVRSEKAKREGAEREKEIAEKSAEVRRKVIKRRNQVFTEQQNRRAKIDYSDRSLLDSDWVRDKSDTD